MVLTYSGINQWKWYLQLTKRKNTAQKIFFPLKFVSANFYQIFIFSPNDNPLKTIKNVLYFI